MFQGYSSQPNLAQTRPDLIETLDTTTMTVKDIEDRIELLKNDVAQLCTQIGHVQGAQFALSPSRLQAARSQAGLGSAQQIPGQQAQLPGQEAQQIPGQQGQNPGQAGAVGVQAGLGSPYGLQQAPFEAAGLPQRTGVQQTTPGVSGTTSAASSPYAPQQASGVPGQASPWTTPQGQQSIAGLGTQRAVPSVGTQVGFGSVPGQQAVPGVGHQQATPGVASQIGATAQTASPFSVQIPPSSQQAGSSGVPPYGTQQQLRSQF